jgi:hypothetical protein
LREPTILSAVLVPLAVALAAPGCRSVECAQGTIERDGRCEPASITVDPATCGPFTELQGDRCVPQFPPTECDPETTTPDLDPATGVTTCIGTGGGGCCAPFACPTPTTATQQTICGQLYELETNTRFSAADATGARCAATPTIDGPCSLSIEAYDAIAFASNPQGATPLAHGDVYIDDCGRYRVTDIEVPSGPFIGLGIDDASGPGPSGTTVTVGLATPKVPMTATRDFEAFVVKATTTGMWAASGGPALAGGLYFMTFRAHRAGAGDPRAPQAGVTVTKAGNPIADNDYYFAAAETTHQTIDAAAAVTGANGSALVTGASIADSVAYSGAGGLGAGCRWSVHAGASLPGVVFIQVVRKLDAPGETCAD